MPPGSSRRRTTRSSTRGTASGLPRARLSPPRLHHRPATEQAGAARPAASAPEPEARGSARISRSASTASPRRRAPRHDLDAFYAEMHAIVGELMYADNMYIALYDADRQRDQLPVLRRHGRYRLPIRRAWEPFGVGRRPRRHRLRLAIGQADDHGPAARFEATGGERGFRARRCRRGKRDVGARSLPRAGRSG